METMSGKDVISIVGTGGGKSLTFMLPALLSSKPTIVVAPTKSLIEDMVDRAKYLSIPSCKYTSDVSLEARKEQTTNLSRYRLVFCTPESLQEDLYEKVQNLVENDGIERIVFDEAHTCDDDRK
jgi:ATP-dependent DNA helicase RecQ